MTDNEVRDRIIVPALAALLVCAMYTCDSAERKGMCHEAWTYTSTTADTLATVRRGCSLPPTRTP